jgi:hypothetical protein
VTDAAGDLRENGRQPDLATNGATLTKWLQLIRGEYLEVPGLQLTRSQVQRLWGLDDVTCDAVVARLVDTRFLRRTLTNAFVRA